MDKKKLLGVIKFSLLVIAEIMAFLIGVILSAQQLPNLDITLNLIIVALCFIILWLLLISWKNKQ